MNTLYIMRGIPGAGKSHIARTIANGDGEIFSADDFFMEDGEYKFDRSRIGEAHEHCKSNVVNAMAEGTRHIVVDNTHVRRWEYMTYINMAALGGYSVHVVEVMPVDEKALQLCISRCTHGVPDYKIREMFDNFEHLSAVKAAVLGIKTTRHEVEVD